MVTKEFALEQVNRLWQLNYYPRDPEQTQALNELVTAARGADSNQTLETAIASILYDAEDCPKPADIRRVVHSENERARELEASRRKESEQNRGRCEFCGGTGWANRTYLLTTTTEEISGDRVIPRVIKKYLLNETEIEAARKALEPGQEILSGVDRCSCQAKS